MKGGAGAGNEKRIFRGWVGMEVRGKERFCARRRRGTFTSPSLFRLLPSFHFGLSQLVVFSDNPLSLARALSVLSVQSQLDKFTTTFILRRCLARRLP